MKPLRVLIMEDEPIIAMLLSEVLGEMGHEVCGTELTESGGVATALKCRPDLMIVDVHLRDGSGISAVENILRSGFIPHVFVSGDMLRGQALSPRAVVMQKPFCEPDLARAIDRALVAAEGA